MLGQAQRDLAKQCDALRAVIAEWGYDPLFLTVTGVDAYGFPSSDSDYDLRGAYLLPLPHVIGLDTPQDTIMRIAEARGMKVDLVLYDLGKLLRMVASGNGSILEEIFSPLPLAGVEQLEMLRALAKGCISRRLYPHYRGFAASHLAKLERQNPKLAKTLLYVYRSLMTGIHVLQNGELEVNIVRLNDRFGFDFLPELIAAKVTELSPLPGLDWGFHRRVIGDLQGRLHAAFRSSCLPHGPKHLAALEEYLIELRLARWGLVESPGTP